jgi:hypothetical protein
MEIASAAAREGESSWHVVEDSAPPIARVVVYRTAAYQMTGYFNRSGRWVGMDGIPETQPVKWWRPIQSRTSAEVAPLFPA